MTKGLTGENGLSYLGVNAKQPPNIAMYKRAPTVNDWQNFIIGDIWMNITPTPPATREIYMLVALLQNQATWVKFLTGTGFAVTSLLDQTGNAVYPTSTGFINTIGDGVWLKTVASVNTITIMPVNSGGLMSGLTADTGITAVPTVAGLIDVKGGANINTVGTANTITVNLDTSVFEPATSADQSSGVYAIGGAPFMHAYGVSNVWLGDAGNFTLTTANAASNVGIGFYALSSLVGSGPLLGDQNVAIGYNAMHLATDSGNNVCIGHASAEHILTGSFNVCLGQQAGQTYVGDESDNICIGAVAEGVVGDSNTLRIGRVTGSATGDGQLKAAYICGIYGGTAQIGTVALTTVDSNNQLGTTDFTSTATSWNPTLAIGGSSVGITYQSPTGGYYYQIGNVVFITAEINLVSKGISTGNVTLIGLPIVPSVTGFKGMTSLYVTSSYTTYIGANLYLYIVGGSTTATFGVSSSTGVSSTALTDSEIANNTHLTVTGFYFI